MTAALVPPWLEPLLRAPYFSTCRAHGVSARSERNMFCLDCPAASAFCFYCRSAHHSDHRTIQIRRSSYHDVVRVSEIQKVLDVGGVQTYVINSARVMFLNERPQPKGGGGSGGGGSASASTASAAGAGRSGGGPHICEICSRTLLDPFRFCSLGCKLERVRRHGDTTFQVDESAAREHEDGGRRADAAALPPPEERGRRWRRRARNAGAAAATTTEEDSRGGGGSERQHEDSGFPSPPLAAAPPLTAPPTHGSRRRKGIPHRSPLASS